jgi:hypothetical protein
VVVGLGWVLILSNIGPIDLKPSAFEREINSTETGCILAGLFSAVRLASFNLLVTKV